MSQLARATSRAVLWLSLATALTAALIVTPALAATRITEPSTSPFHVVLDPRGEPIPFTVAATGFPPDANVFAEQCDGRATSEPNWSPTRDCDAGSAPGPVSADSSGAARFDAANPNRRILFFVGASPENIFNCLPPGAPDPKNQLRSFSNCQIRVSTNNTKATTDQVFLPIVLGTSAAASSSNDSKVPLVLGIIGAAVLAAIVVWLITRARARRA